MWYYVVMFQGQQCWYPGKNQRETHFSNFRILLPNVFLLFALVTTNEEEASRKLYRPCQCFRQNSSEMELEVHCFVHVIGSKNLQDSDKTIPGQRGTSFNGGKSSVP